jgi:hypothetical protein
MEECIDSPFKLLCNLFVFILARFIFNRYRYLLVDLKTEEESQVFLFTIGKQSVHEQNSSEHNSNAAHFLSPQRSQTGVPFPIFMVGISTSKQCLNATAAFPNIVIHRLIIIHHISTDWAQTAQWLKIILDTIVKKPFYSTSTSNHVWL